MGRIRPKERARKRVLSDEELRKVWITAKKCADAFGAYVRFLLLTASRRDEARALVWTEINNAVWTLPARRNKTKQELVRPLSKPAFQVLESLPRIEGCDFVFPGTRGKAINSLSLYKRKLDKTSGVSGWTLHDLRRTARSLMSRAGVNGEHAERCLGHSVGGLVRETYDRHEYLAEKRHAFEALAAQIERIVNPVENVVPMRG